MLTKKTTITVDDAKQELEKLLPIWKKNRCTTVSKLWNFGRLLQNCNDVAPSPVCEAVDLKPGATWAMVAAVLKAKWLRERRFVSVPRV